MFLLLLLLNICKIWDIKTLLLTDFNYVSETIGIYLKVNCKPKFWLTEGIRSVTVTCGENGRWIPELKCLPVSCPDPTVDDATFDFVAGRSNHSDHYPVGSKIKFACNEGTGCIIVFYFIILHPDPST